MDFFKVKKKKGGCGDAITEDTEEKRLQVQGLSLGLALVAQ